MYLKVVSSITLLAVSTNTMTGLHCIGLPVGEMSWSHKLLFKDSNLSVTCQLPTRTDWCNKFKPLASLICKIVWAVHSSKRGRTSEGSSLKALAKSSPTKLARVVSSSALANKAYVWSRCCSNSDIMRFKVSSLTLAAFSSKALASLSA